MSRRLRILPEAESELAEAAVWYEIRRPGLGAKFVAVVDRALEQIVESPSTVPRWHEGRPYRKLTLRRFPFIIFFTASEIQVVITAFAHAKRRPGYWLGRSDRGP